MIPTRITALLPLLGLLIAALGLYGAEATLSEFVNPSVDDLNGAGIPGPVTAGPITIKGNSYSTGHGTIRYNALMSCISVECVGTDFGLDFLEITLATPVRKLGIWIDQRSSAELEFFGSTGSKLGGFRRDGKNTLTKAFAGWAVDGDLIKRMRITQLPPSGGSNYSVDNLTWESVPSFTAAGVVNAASFAAGGVAPGGMITIFGSGFGPEFLARSMTSSDFRLATEVGDTRLLFNGVAAPLVYVTKNQLSAIVPFMVIPNTSVTTVLEYKKVQSAPVQLNVVLAAPAIFTSNSSGRGQAALLNQDGTLNTPANPAPRGTIVVFWLTGAGQTEPMGLDGRIAGSPLPTVKLPVVVGIDNIGAEVLYAGAAPGLVEGIIQVNARVPMDVRTGASVPLVTKIGDTFSAENVTVAIR